MIMVIAVIIIVLLIALIAVVIYFAFKKQKPSPADELAEERKAMVKKGRSHLMDLRRLGMKVQNQDVRALNEQICMSADKIFQTLQEKPECIPNVRKFFNYYLPTQGSILEKYIRVESSGVPSGELTHNVVSCLGDIRKAMEKQYNNLFDDDILDLTVEMEVMTAVCKRDGLLAEEEVTQQNTMKLTL